MKAIRALGTLLKGYLIVIGLLTHLALAGGVLYGLRHYQLTVDQALVKLMERSGVDWPWLVALATPEPRYQDHVMDGRLREEHPRILMPQLASWNGRGVSLVMAERDVLYQRLGIRAPGPCVGGDLLGLTACWLATGEPGRLAALRSAVNGFRLTTPNVQGNYGNGWELAFAYDFLSLHDSLSPQDRQNIQARLRQAAKELLQVLDGDSASLWHGRSNLAAQAWLCVVVLDGTDPRNQALLRRAQGYFLDTLSALKITEGWPEGYNYWIQNRGLPLALAGAAYLNGLKDSAHGSRVREILRRTGYWHIYGVRPDQRFEGLGDEGSRVDLKDETRRVIDVLAQATRDPVLAGYSQFLGNLHGRESYYRDYRGGFWLFNDPTVSPITGQGLSRYQNLLGTTELFGPDGLNLAYIRSDWSPQGTFISFRAGDTFTHHGHYDAGHFSLFKGAPLAINSSSYGGTTSSNRLNYSIRSVAKNTLLVLRPGERVQPNRFFEANVADGGQRVVLPTGSAIEGVGDWFDNLGQGLHLEGGSITRFDFSPGLYSYFDADLTAAYNNPAHDEGGSGGKVEQINRELFYLQGEDRLIVHDRVTAIDADYTKKWLLHTVQRPQVQGLQVLKGSADNGIMESPASLAVVENGPGRLVVQRFQPQDAVIRLVGGEDYQYYVESDGDDSDLDGENFARGAREEPWFDIGQWRIEIQPAVPRRRDVFLMVLSPSLDNPREDLARPLDSADDNIRGVITGRSAVVFVDRGQLRRARLRLPEGISQIYILGLPELTSLQLGPVAATVNRNGVALVDGSWLAGGEMVEMVW
ncbi:MAG: hypothetical protein R3310_10060 [Candidatus Competibacteraceae bacterium]|nr:hypothetical protein [Candidatus Competibacteraceae bacterium]